MIEAFVGAPGTRSSSVVTFGTSVTDDEPVVRFDTSKLAQLRSEKVHDLQDLLQNPKVRSLATEISLLRSACLAPDRPGAVLLAVGGRGDLRIF